MESFNIMLLSSQLGKTLGLEKRDSICDMPWFSLPPGYSFKVTFPFNGAAARFRVRKDSNPDNDVSVYYDTKDVLGFMGAPYWEACPIGDDVARYLRGEEAQMIKDIIKQLNGEYDTQSND